MRLMIAATVAVVVIAGWLLLETADLAVRTYRLALGTVRYTLDRPPRP